MIPFLKHWIAFTNHYINQRRFGATHIRTCVYVYMHHAVYARKYIFNRQFDFSPFYHRDLYESYFSKQHRTRDCYAYHMPNEQLLLRIDSLTYASRIAIDLMRQHLLSPLIYTSSYILPKNQCRSYVLINLLIIIIQ